MAKIVLLEEVLGDMKHSRDWYDEQEQGLGELFVERITECIEKIADNPKAYPVKYRILRARLIQTFPYSVFYRVEKENEVHVYAVLHHRQNANRILTAR